MHMACSYEATSPSSSSSTITCSISAVHSDLLETHILTRLDGPTLASAACVSTELYSLITCNQTLWANICHSTWPSTNTPLVSRVISSFDKGPRSFFSDSSTNPDPSAAAASESAADHDPPSELISAVDIYYRNKLMLSKVVETETVSGWYQCSPFRVDLLDPKDTVATRIPYPDTEEACRELAEDFTLSWILIDPIGRRAMNLSSQKAVRVQRHWLSGEVHVWFAWMLSGEEQCGIVITCGGSEGGEMHVREVSLQVEDMDGMHLNGKESLVILRRGLEGKRENKRRRGEEGKRRYEEYLELRRIRKERKLRTEGTLDMLCAASGVFIFTSLALFAFWR
ncbi:hypothetical protein ACOSP7_028873 [Xanthoceras sorbifolium]|uniref:F-box protein n=1 Tax=Xanthoceras sorbifolium TaxID=99658 RepID=A0ABQ8HC93_9ROSI|nr:hypothetical protein JRO89_XS12G0115600 [Xanthoceras sorbifolium]